MQNERKTLVDYYLLLGFIFSIILNLINKYQNFEIMAAFCLVFYMIYFKLYNKYVSDFLKNHVFSIALIMLLAIIAFFLGNSFLNKINKELQIISYFIIYVFGYAYISESIDYKLLKRRITPLSIFIILSAIYGIITFYAKINPIDNIFAITNDNTLRMHSLYVHPIPASCLFLIGLLLTYYSNLNSFNKFVSTLILIYALVLTGTRSITFLSLIVILILIGYQLKHSKEIRISINSIYIFGIFLVIILFVFCIFNKDIVSLVNKQFTRYQANGMYNDISYSWRQFTRISILNQLAPNNLFTYIGHGNNAAANFIMNFGIIGPFTYNVATVDNQYLTLLYDYGVIGFVIFVYLLIKSVIRLINSNTKEDLILTLSVLIIFIEAVFFDAIYWINIAFLFTTFLGYICGATKIKNQN